MNNVLNLVIKVLLKHPRPNKPGKLSFNQYRSVNCIRSDGKTLSSYGMPSDHSQTIWFFFSFLTLIILFR